MIQRFSTLQRIQHNSQHFTWLYLVMLLAIIIGVYYPTFLVPFYLDDRDSIVTNSLVQADTLGPLLASNWLRMRFIGYFTLWLNYQYGGLEPVGYHWVNIIIHCINSLLVFVLARQLLNYFYSDVQDRKVNNLWWALFVAVIWALHPLNTQAVTYVVQRLASIVAIFYLLTIIFYIKAREQQNLYRVLGFMLLVMLCVAAGLHAKQNFVSVFLFLWLWELLTARDNIRHYLQWSMIAGIIAILIVAPFVPWLWQSLDSFTRDFNATTRVQYFYTQMVVLWDYVLRFLWPFSLQLEIDATLRKSLEPIVALALMSHLLVIGLAYRNRKTMPLLLVGVLIFYCSHSIESFIIPIKDLAFEHRTYIGNIGLLVCVLAVLKRYWLTDNNVFFRVVVTSIFAVIIVFSITIFNRNTLWQDPLAFYAYEVQLSPGHARANASYGEELMKIDRNAEAEIYLKKAVDLNLAQGRMTASGITALMTVLYKQEKFQQAANVAMLGLKYIKNPLDRSALLSNLAYGYIRMNYCDFAKGLLNNALSLDPNNNQAKANLAYCMKQQSGG